MKYIINFKKIHKSQKRCHPKNIKKKLIQLFLKFKIYN